MRSTLVAALVSCADSPHKSRARRFVQGLSSDELQFIAEFLGARLLDSDFAPALPVPSGRSESRAIRQASEAFRCGDREHKMIVLLEYLCRAGDTQSQGLSLPVHCTIDVPACGSSWISPNAVSYWRHILLQDVEQRLGLLRADIDALKVVDRDVIRRRLVHPAEHQEEVPQVHADLHAVGIVLAILRGVDELNLRWPAAAS